MPRLLLPIPRPQQTTATPSNLARKSTVTNPKRPVDSTDTGNRTASNSHQDTMEAVGIQLVNLLTLTKEHVQTLLNSFIRFNEGGPKADPQLERVLVELINGILQSHNAFATRDNISSQKQPSTFRPTVLRSLAQLRELLSLNPPLSQPPPQMGSVSSLPAPLKYTVVSSRSECPGLGPSRQRSTPLFPSRLSMSTLPSDNADTDVDTENRQQAEWVRAPPAGLEESVGIYHSTVEHLALMTALVSVVCWIMQTQLDTSANGGHPDRTTPAGHEGHSFSTGMSHDNSQHRPNSLIEFLDLFDDQDNVLKPIRDALAIGQDHSLGQGSGAIELDPTKHVGLFAWHYYLFASDPEGPLIKNSQLVSVVQLSAVDFDVILNELYTTQVLSKSVKEHQKDHGQFYTPPAVVEFMWKRSIVGYGDLLDRFTRFLEASRHVGLDNTTPSPSEPLIPTALDPCLGVSTFLSSYVRLLIREARLDPYGRIWNSVEASRLLLCQLCNHVWGIELDGFAFWMARCGILAALMPLVQRVQALSRAISLAYHPDFGQGHYSFQQRNTSKLPRLHLFQNDTLQLKVPLDNSPAANWEYKCLSRLRDPSCLQFDFIVTNPPYMIRKTGTFSAPDSELYDWNILGSGLTPAASTPKTSRTKSAKLKGARRSDVKADDRNSSVQGMDYESARDSESSIESAASLRTERSSTPVKPNPKGMMQMYGYFIWFAAQRIRPGTGVTCMITASQWLTLEFAAKLRAWLFDNCLLDEFFQFEPYKVFPKAQTDSLIFKIHSVEVLRTDPSFRKQALKEHGTVFLRHMGHHEPLAGILQDYTDYFKTDSSGSINNLNIMASWKSRQELSDAMDPSTYSFAPMMPSSWLATYMSSLTQDLGRICSAGAKKLNRSTPSEPLLWHRGPNTNPLYGLVVRMEYARGYFGEIMTQRWFRPAFYWNGKNSPEETTSTASSGAPTKPQHKEGDFWKSRDRLRLSKKEGSAAESYCIPTSDPQRLYALCMVDKESVKELKQQVEQNIEGAKDLWDYLRNVRIHFQPGLEESSSGKQHTAKDNGIACCSTNQCGVDVAEKIVHPINYGYFSKTQPRQRFFLDKDRMAVTNQCIYLTSNKLLQRDTPMVYFLTLLNSSTLQFFVLENCKYDQQGRMRLFRELMANIPFQDWDVKHNPGRVQYASQLGDLMMELKEIIYNIVSAWHLTGHQSQGGGTSSSGASTSQTLLDWVRRGGDPPAGVLEKTKNQVQKMLMTTAGTMTLTHTTPYASQSPSPSISSMIRSSNLLAASFADTDTDADTDANTDLDDRVEACTPPTIQEHIVEDQGAWMVDDRGYTMQEMGSSGSDLRHATGYRSGSVATSGSDTPSTTSSSLPSHNVVTFNNISNERDRIIQAIERVIAMIEILQWAVDQYGYMLYGIQPMIQRLLEQELKLVYGSVVTALVEPSSSVNEDMSSGPMPGLEPLLDRTTLRMPTQAPRNEDQKRALTQLSENTVSRLEITITGLYRWGDYNEDEDLSHVMKNNHLHDPSTPVGLGHAQIPSYAPSLLENAQAAAQSLREFLERYSGSRS
ncbi:hypothetical protein BGX34_009369 [Mortierella sp. NVP85]|nr:hypothetical protein BGX34_009369 [Mortierella sp. NVP85]